jgi:hypothetical protein
MLKPLIEKGASLINQHDDGGKPNGDPKHA